MKGKNSRVCGEPKDSLQQLELGGGKGLEQVRADNVPVLLQKVVGEVRHLLSVVTNHIGLLDQPVALGVRMTLTLTVESVAVHGGLGEVALLVEDVK